MRFYATEAPAVPTSGYPFLVGGPDKERIDSAIEEHFADVEVVLEEAQEVSDAGPVHSPAA